MNTVVNCHLCGAGPLRLWDALAPLRLVTSDCKPWRAGGRKGCCPACGTAQAAIDSAWRDGCHEIYSSYDVYHQGGGHEQTVFAADSNKASPRSLRLLEKVVSAVNVPEYGRALDIGCGNGNFIRSFAALRPKWRLNGAEYNAIYREQVLSISGVEGFYAGDFETIPGPFDFVSLIHVLEHIENPVSFLRKIAALAPSATLLIEVPFFHDNPYELLIADHATHYTPETLRRVLHRAGYAIHALQTDWIVKEISALVVPLSAPPPAPEVDPEEEFAAALRAVDFLVKVKEEAKVLRAGTKTLGVFGSSIGGTWLHSELEGRVDFFVDEDPARIGNKHLGTPILSPAQVPTGSAVFMPLAARVARDVARRLENSSGANYFYFDPPKA